MNPASMSSTGLLAWVTKSIGHEKSKQVELMEDRLKVKRAELKQAEVVGCG